MLEAIGPLKKMVAVAKRVTLNNVVVPFVLLEYFLLNFTVICHRQKENQFDVETF